MIEIKKSKSADTRSAGHTVSREELETATKSHRDDVRKTMSFFSRIIARRGTSHDYTKTFYMDEFYEQFRRSQETGEWGAGWYDRIHIEKERHHLNDRCPDDVNLIDVLEMICDGVAAGLARTGEYRMENLSPEILEKAFRNTATLLLDNVRLVSR